MRLLVFLLLVASLHAEFECGKLTKASGTVIRGRASIHTGSKSRIELEFPNRTVVRIGSYASFECVPGALEMILDSGTLLLSSPKGTKQKAIVQAGALVITGSDFQLSNVENKTKVIGLNGKTTTQLTANPKEQSGLRPGEIVEVPAGATEMPPTKAVNLKTLISTSILMKMGPLPSQGAIEKNAAKQQPHHSFRVGALSPDAAEAAIGLAAQAMQTAAITTRQEQIAQLAQQQAAAQAAADAAAQQQIAAARQLAVQQQQAQRIAAEQQQRQAAQQQANQGGGGPQGNQGKGPQGNQGQKPPSPPGQGNKPPAPPGQNK